MIVTGGSRSTKLISVPTVAATIGDPTSVLAKVSLSTTLVAGRRAGFS